MEVYLNRIDGFDDAIVSMFLSKRTLTRELEWEIREAVYHASLGRTSPNGTFGELCEAKMSDQLKDWMDKLFKWGRQHMTMLRFIDLSFSIYGLHRGGQDDYDSHAMRMNNRIIRSSTRLADFSKGEVSEYYADKIIPTDVALAYLGITTPDEIEFEGRTYVRSVNGYIVKGMENNKDVKRGLYMLSIPSNFICRWQLTEFSHLYKERNQFGTAHPELKQAVEESVDLAEAVSAGYINRQLLYDIPN